LVNNFMACQYKRKNGTQTHPVDDRRVFKFCVEKKPHT